MTAPFSRRDWIKTVGVAGAGALVPGVPIEALGAESAIGIAPPPPLATPTIPVRELYAPGDIVELYSTSEVYIPPSHFVVQPYVGWMDHRPTFVPNPTEVSELLIEPLDRFFQPGAIRSGRIFLPAYQMHIHAPYFEVQGRMLWGATAMMLQEFRVAMSGPEIPAG
mgnify:CR=1 FL=1